MKVIVFGAAGTVGKQVVLQALGLDHSVTGFVRSDKNKLTDIKHENLRIVKGDVLDAEAVTQATKGHDAVICVLGAGSKGTVRAQGTRNIIDAMERVGIKRLICQTTLGAGDSKGNLNFFWKYIMFGWLLKEAFKDHELQEQYVISSQLDWTLVRPSAFTDGPATGNFKHGFGSDEKFLKLKISRADVAMFLLMQLDSDQYLRKAASVSY